MRWLPASLALLAAPLARAQLPQTLNQGGVAPAVILLDCALSSDLTCSTGETLTFTRSTTGALCDATNAEATHVTEPAINTACFNDVHGVRVVGAIKNELGGSETFNDSVADWLGVDTPATVTLDQDDSPLDGADTLADTITDDSGLNAERVRQVVSTTTAGTYRFSVWLRDTEAHTASLRVSADTVPETVNTCDVSVLTTYKRFECALTTAAPTSGVTVYIYPAEDSDGTLQDSVFAWGAQLQGPASGDKGEFLAPYCRSTGASATTCATEALAVTGDIKNSSGTLRVDYTPMHTMATTVAAGNVFFGANGTGGTFGLMYRNTGSGATVSFDGTSSISITPSSFAAKTTQVLRLTWLGGTRKVAFPTLGESSTGAYDGAFRTTLDGFGVGSTADDPRRGWGYFKHLQSYSKPTTRTPTYTALVDCSLVSDLTCASGDTLTFTRSTVGALCPSTGDEDAEVTEPAINTACHHPDYGVRVVGSVKNELGHSEAFDNAVWGKTNATVTAGAGDAPLSGTDTLADRIEDNEPTNASSVQQNVSTTTTGTYRFSMWLCNESGSDPDSRIGINTDGTGTNLCTVQPAACPSYSRVECAATVGGSPTYVRPTVYPKGATNASTGAVLAWGAQLQGPGSGEQGKFLAPYCRSTGASATTCSAEHILVAGAGNFKQGGGKMSADITPLYQWNTSSNPDTRIFVVGDGAGGETGGLLLYKNPDSANFISSDGTTGTAFTISGAALTTKTVGVAWRNTRRQLTATGIVTVNDAYDGRWASEATPTEIYLGGRASATPQRGWAYFKNWRIYSDSDPIP